MKKSLAKTAHFGVAAAIVAALSACVQQVKTEAITIKTEKYAVSDSVQLAEGYPYYLYIDFDIDFPVNDAGNAAMQTICDSIGRHLLGENYAGADINAAIKSQIEKAAADYRNELAADVSNFGNEVCNSCNYGQSTKGYVTHNDGRYMSYAVDYYEYTGGAHGNYGTRHYNFRLGDGKQTSESDLFAPGFEAALADTLKARVALKFCDSGSVADLAEYGFYPEDIKPNGNFRLTDSSIIFVFVPYEIGPYAVGQVEVEVAMNELEMRW